MIRKILTDDKGDVIIKFTEEEAEPMNLQVGKNYRIHSDGKDENGTVMLRLIEDENGPISVRREFY